MRLILGITLIVCGGLAAAITAACGSDAGSTIPDPDAGEAGSSGASSGPREAGAGGVTADGGIDPPGAGPGGDTNQIACGTTTCPIPAETCCVSDVQNGGRGFACVAGSTCPQPAGGGGDTTALKCASSANCASGTVCCVTENGGVASSECKASCTGGDSAQLCDPKQGDAGGCPEASPCSSKDIGDWGLSPPFATCGGIGN